MTFRKVGHLGWPVVHLGIDVDGVFTVPRGIHTTIPHALQVSSLTSWLRRGDKQITSILIEQGYEIEVVRIIEVLNTYVGLCLRCLCHGDVESDTVKLLAILIHMIGKKFCV